MKNIGSFLLIIGVAAIIMDFMNYVPRLLYWIYNWGTGVAWAIKIGLVIIGAILYFLGRNNQKA